MTETEKACYRKLKKYKYQLVQGYRVTIAVTGKTIDTGYIALSPNGELTIRDRYAWDGPSGPTIDTRSFMRGSLVHDALYQLMRMGKLKHKDHRAYADDLLKQMCMEDGMWKIRTGWVHWGVKKFGEKFAKPSPEAEDGTICVP